MVDGQGWGGEGVWIPVSLAGKRAEDTTPGSPSEERAGGLPALLGLDGGGRSSGCVGRGAGPGVAFVLFPYGLKVWTPGFPAMGEGDPPHQF